MIKRGIDVGREEPDQNRNRSETCDLPGFWKQKPNGEGDLQQARQQDTWPARWDDFRQHRNHGFRLSKMTDPEEGEGQ